MGLLQRFKNTNEKNKILIKNISGAFIIKGVSLIVSFVTTPLFISYFNNNLVLGIWYTLLSTLTWFLNFDLGLGNGIRNYLVKDISSNDLQSARTTISTGMLSVAVVAFGLFVIGTVLIFKIDLYWLYNIKGGELSYRALRLSTVFVFLAIVIRFFLTTITSIFYALQKASINNFLALCVSLLQLLFVLLFRFKTTEEALINISFAYIFLSNLPVVIAGLIVFCGELKSCRPSLSFVQKSRIHAILNVGVLFFICQLLYMVISNTNEFFVTNMYGAQYTAEYSFYHKLSSLVSVIIALSLTPVWSLVTKAQAEKDYVWLRNLFGKIKRAGALVLILQLCLVPLMPTLMNLWLGKNVIEVNTNTSLAFALFSAIFVYSGMLSTITNGLAQMKIQTICFTVGVVLKIVLIVVFHNNTTWSFVVWTNAIILLPYIIAQSIALDRQFNNYCNT